MIRKATRDDLDRMLELAAMKRTQYSAYSPIFWRPSASALERQGEFFATLVTDAGWICLVHEATSGVNGFIIARVVNAPPVYDPGGPVCMIDDFVVASPDLWPSVGLELQRAAERLSGAVISITVCGQKDGKKRAALEAGGAHVSSEWYVHEIAKP